MLRLENITKNYEAGGQSFPALKGINIAFRKNEFVSILGPSGCGKTTLLNIIGGLDHYTSGDLFIEGTSTKEYTSHDWDVYRNHRIGFIFQSYNLIPHQNILENVELALTIAGYSKEEKIAKAKKALDMVGLKNAYKKMPNQLSGGQCQRVAIARALVNEPDILLGDEPTGALDSKTSVQVMELIKKISKKKLVIMVTHNPPLAEKYSTRIISLLDGKKVGDTNPYSLEEERKEKRTLIKKVKISTGKGTTSMVKPDKAKMSFIDAFKLSAKNLISKKKRTLMVIAASSIGIVGVSAVLAVSAGVRGYIGNMQNDMLSGNPIRASETSLDLASALSRLSNLLKAEAISDAWKGDHIDIEFLTKRLIEAGKTGSFIQNDVNDYYVEYLKEINQKANANLISEVNISYGMNFADNIYTVSEVSDPSSFYEIGKTAYSISGLKNIYTTILGTLDDGTGKDYVPLANIAANFPNIFYQGLDNNDYIKTQYNIVKGRLPDITATNECVVVLNRRNKFPDLLVTLAGMYSQENFIKAMYEFIKDNPDMSKIQTYVDFDKILNQKIFYVPSGTDGKEGAFRNGIRYNYRFKYDENNKKLIRGAIEEQSIPENSIDIKDGDNDCASQIHIVGIITPKEGKKYGSLPSGIYFPSSMGNKIMKLNQSCDLVEDVMKRFEKPKIDNYVFIPNGQKEATHNIGLTYPLEVNVLNDQGKQTGKKVETYGTVGSSVAILTDYKDPFVEPEKAVAGTFITSSIDSRQFAGLKAIEKKTSTDGNKSYEFKQIVKSAELYIDDFGKKDIVISYLDKWNGNEKITINDPYNPGKTIELKGVKDGGRNTVTYTDNLTLIISMVNNLINVTTLSLTIFASLALVVSTVMIGIITYISVMERIKEIGVIRSLGGRKKDVSHLFNAETFILGGLSGAFGILITYTFEIIVNIIVKNMYKIPMIANLKWYTAIIMILLSIVLTAISGLIPARSAAKKDPVIALRSE